MKIFSIIVLTVCALISSARAGTINLSTIDTFAKNYKLIGACHTEDIDDTQIIVVILHNLDNGELILGSDDGLLSFKYWFSLGKKIRTNNNYKFVTAERDGGMIQYEKTALKINKKSGLGEFSYEEQRLGDIPFPKKTEFDLDLKDCRFKK